MVEYRTFFDLRGNNTYFEVGSEERLRGTYVVGVMGAGKSTLLTTMINGDIWRGRGVCLIDPHGDLIDDVLDRASFHGRQADVRLLDLQSHEVAFGLNLFACPNPLDPVAASRTAGRVVDVFKKVWGDGSWGPRLEDLLANAAVTLVANPGATLADFPGLLTDLALRKRLVSRLQNRVVRDYWVNEYDQMRPGMQQQVYGPVMNKVRAFLRDPLLYDIVSQSESSLDLRAAIEANLIVLVRLDSDQEEATSLLGAIFLQQLLEAAFARRDMSREERTPFMVFFDECHLFATPSFVKLLREVRKFGIGVTAATQLDSALPENVATVFSGSSTVACFRVTDRDARRLQSRFDGSAFKTEPVYDPDPLGTLLSKGHPNPDLVAKAQDVATMLAHWQQAKDQYLKVRSTGYHVASLPSHVKRLRASIDAWLFSFMRGELGRQDLMDDLRQSLYVDPEATDRHERYMELLVTIWQLAKALEASPLLLRQETDRARIVHELTHLPVGHALISYAKDGVPHEALAQTLVTSPGPTFRPRPLGIKREAPSPLPPEPKELIYFDDPDPDAPPPWIEPR